MKTQQKIIKTKAGVIIFLILFLRGISLMDAQDKDINYTPSKIFSEDELPQKILDALRGDLQASDEIAYYYGLIVRDLNEFIKWQTIAAENGVGEGIYMLVSMSSSNNVETKTRGLFWLYTMANNGYRLDSAERELNRLGYTLETAQPPEDSFFPDNYAQLSEAELDLCKTGALQGNRKAALLLGKYYEEITVDNELSEYWYRIGSQNGSPECQYKLGWMLRGKDNQKDQIRGRFWIDLAAQNGYNEEM